MTNWSENRDTFYRRLSKLGPDPEVRISSASGSVILTRSHFDAFEGEGNHLAYAALGLCLSGGGPARRETDSYRFEGEWRPGRVGLALPGPPARGYAPSQEMLLIAFQLDEVPACHGHRPTPAQLRLAASQLYHDELITSVMIALMRDAEAHGAASAFFEHGLSLILHRLVARTDEAAARPVAPAALRKPQLSDTIELIETRLADDLRVKEMAATLGIDPRTFTRRFRQRTGYSPYQYLTLRRMERAKHLLQSEGSVTDTALAVGYANPAKFSAAFRRWVGVSPSQWRAESRHRKAR